MTHVPRPLADPPRATARPPSPRRNEDHEPHLSGGARYVSGKQMRPRARLQDSRTDRARSLLLRQLTSGGGGF
jgi:hypothetical protein